MKTTEKLAQFAEIWQKVWAWLYDIIKNGFDLGIKDDPDSSFPNGIQPVA